MNLLTIDVAREHMREREEEITQPDRAARVRAIRRRARRDARARAMRVSRLLLTR